MEKGILYGVGVGPGDPELMTLKAVNIARRADMIAVPHKDPTKCTALSIALKAVPEIKQKPILPVDMPMTKDKVKLEQAYAAGAQALMDALEEGKTVCFLTLGDPTVYSTYLYLHKRAAAAGYQAEIIPGVPSFCAAAAALGISLCENEQQLHIIPGTYTPREALDYPGVKVMMKNNLPATLAALRERGDEAVMAENCGMDNQRLFRSLDEIPQDAGYFSLLIVKDGKARPEELNPEP